MQRCSFYFTQSRREIGVAHRLLRIEDAQLLNHCVSACPQKHLRAKGMRETTTTSHVFFLTRMTRIFRNCHPAHFDKTEHRDAMGGYHGSCHPYLLLAFPEGDKRLIGHGWHAWRPQGDMTCLPCLSSRRMDELCRSSTGYRNQQRIAPTIIHKTLNSYRVLIHSVRRLDRVVASRQPCPIKSLSPSGKANGL